MKILHASETFYPSTGGGQKHVYDLCMNLIANGHQSDVLTFKEKKLSSFEKLNGINIYRIPHFSLKYYKIPRPFFKRLKEYDLIHIHSIGFFSDFLTLTKFIHKKPLVISTHGGFFHTKKITSLKNIYFNYWLRVILKKIDKVIATSKNDEKLFSRISKNIVCIPNAIEMKKFLKIKRRPKPGNFLTVGRIAENKRIDRLIEVMYFLKKKIPNLRLYIVGHDLKGLRKSLEKLASQKSLIKNVIFTGEISESKLFELLGKAKFFLSASEYEGFGISVLEAMACGIPVIVNDIESFHNFIDNRKNGFILNFDKPKNIADFILRLRDKELSKISKNARGTAREYDWKRAIKRIKKVYKEVLQTCKD